MMAVLLSFCSDAKTPSAGEFPGNGNILNDPVSFSH